MKKDNPNFVDTVLRAAPVHMEILRVTSGLDARLWLGGGAIRNLVWDALTGRKTPLEDFDLVYFAGDDLDVLTEKILQTKIRNNLPSVLNVSVRNQGRMHVENCEPSSSSLFEAISNWPETATAIAARLDAQGAIEFIAPYGFVDLLEMVIRPTPYHEKNPSSFLNRLDKKKWKNVWPELRESASAKKVMSAGRNS